MKRYIIILIIFVSSSCHNHESELMRNVKLQIVGIGGGMERPMKGSDIPYKSLLLKNLSYPGLYTEINQYNSRYILTDSMYYNHKIGDTLFFEYIAKYRFWYKKDSL